MVRRQLKVMVLVSALLSGSGSLSMAHGGDPYAEPSPDYLRRFMEQGTKIFVLERFDAEGKLVARSMERLQGRVEIEGPVKRRIASWEISLRGLIACPTEKVVYNRVQNWNCADAAGDYGEAIYNGRASVILCKTMLLSSTVGEIVPASCFLLVGGNGEPFRTVNDDDGMVFLGLAAIGRTQDGHSRRPDLEETQSLSKSMRFQDAD